MTFCKVFCMAYLGAGSKGKLVTQNTLVEQNKQQKNRPAKLAKKQLL